LTGPGHLQEKNEVVHDYTMSIDVVILEFVLARMKLWVQLGARIEAGVGGSRKLAAF